MSIWTVHNHNGSLLVDCLQIRRSTLPYFLFSGTVSFAWLTCFSVRLFSLHHLSFHFRPSQAAGNGSFSKHIRTAATLAHSLSLGVLSVWVYRNSPTPFPCAVFLLNFLHHPVPLSTPAFQMLLPPLLHQPSVLSSFRRSFNQFFWFLPFEFILLIVSTRFFCSCFLASTFFCINVHSFNHGDV